MHVDSDAMVANLNRSLSTDQRIVNQCQTPKDFTLDYAERPAEITASQKWFRRVAANCRFRLKRVGSTVKEAVLGLDVLVD